MPITFACPECGTQNECAEYLAGCVDVCSQCGRNVIVPATYSDRTASQADPAKPHFLRIALWCVVTMAVVLGLYKSTHIFHRKNGQRRLLAAIVRVESDASNRIDASSLHIDRTLLKRLGRLRTLAYLNFNHTDFSDADLPLLSQLTDLRWLGLERTKVTDAGLKHLTRMKNLSNLRLAETAVSDAGIAQLMMLPSLGVLDVRQTAISEEGVKKLRVRFPSSVIMYRN